MILTRHGIVVRKGDIIAVGIILAVGLFYIATIREGHYWRRDTSLYIAHAKNIVEGKSYQDTGFIYNPLYPSYSPRVYPPIFPLLLSPVYKIFGLDIKAMKIEVICIFMLALFVIHLSFRDDLPDVYLNALVAIVGFNSFFWILKDDVLSDIPFLLFCYLSILLIKWMTKRDNKEAIRPGFLISLGFFLYLDYGVRTIGIILLICFIAHIIFTKMITIKQICLVMALFLFLLLAQNTIIGNDSSYVEQIRVTNISRFIYNNITLYSESIINIWDNNYNEATKFFLFIIISFMSIIGYIYKFSSHFMFFRIFPLMYIPVLLLWPSNQPRFLAPLLPLYIYFALHGLHSIKNHQIIKNIVFVILLVTITGTYICFYSTTEKGVIQGFNTKNSRNLFAYIKKNVPEDALILCRDPRTIALFTDRNATVYHRPNESQELWSYIKSSQVDYVVVGGFGKEMKLETDKNYLYPFIRKNQKYFDKIFDNGSFKVYKIRNYPP